MAWQAPHNAPTGHERDQPPTEMEEREKVEKAHLISHFRFTQIVRTPNKVYGQSGDLQPRQRFSSSDHSDRRYEVQWRNRPALAPPLDDRLAAALPKRVRLPTGRLFNLGCSPSRFMTMQLLSVTEVVWPSGFPEMT